MKKILVILFLIALTTESRAQVTSLAPGEYKSIIIPAYSPIGDYTRGLILLHEAYLGPLLNINYAIGTITALRGNAGTGLTLPKLTPAPLLMTSQRVSYQTTIMPLHGN